MSSKPSSWRVAEATFERSAPDIQACPPASVPEIAVAGRSNVGKSSLLNAFCGQRALARVSRTPGRTRLLNFFAVRLRGAAGDLDVRLVDLPGYGFASAQKSVREGFAPMVEGYFAGRATLCGLLLLIDGRREVSDAEFELLEFMSRRQLPTLLCVTKVDKLKASERGLVASRLANQLGVSQRDIVLTSARDRTGIDPQGPLGGLADEIASLAQGFVA